MHSDRIRPLNAVPFSQGPLLYWMDRELRVEDNWALFYAQQLALERKQPLWVVYNLVINFLGGGSRQWIFKLKALKEIQQRCEEKNISFFLLLDPNGNDTPEQILKFVSQHQLGGVVTDFSPLKIQREWKEKVAKTLKIAFFEVDTHNIVPVWKASSKQEFAAYTLRPKLYKQLPEYLDELPIIQKHPYISNLKPFKIEWNTLIKNSHVNPEVKEVNWIVPGEKAAQDALDHFMESGLATYAERRNDPTLVGQSNLSPYLHYGMLSPQRVAWRVLQEVNRPIDEVMHALKNKAKVDLNSPLQLIDHASAFLEELIVRRELSDNFCFYNSDYDSFKGFPAWAQKTLLEHQNDPREFIYSLRQFEQAQTHDELWNASQLELLHHGKMHGYMRMYWAKKILEWTAHPQEAMEMAIYLNDKYELDGRDPNGYAGIAWSIGGVHDRPWFERPIYGQIRYMARSGCERKFDVKTYIKNQNQASLF